MSYLHHMNVSIKFHHGISVKQIGEALSPLLKYWKCPNAFDQTHDGESLTIENIDEFYLYLLAGSAGNGYTLLITTEGDVVFDYDDIVRSCAARMTALCEPACFEIVDFTRVDLDEAVTSIWAGDPQAVRQARKEAAWTKAKKILGEEGVEETILQRMEAVFDEMESTPQPLEPQEPERHSRVERPSA